MTENLTTLPLEYQISREEVIIYEGNLYQYNDKRFITTRYPATDLEGNELRRGYKVAYLLPDGTVYDHEKYGLVDKSKQDGFRYAPQRAVPVSHQNKKSDRGTIPRAMYAEKTPKYVRRYESNDGQKLEEKKEVWREYVEGEKGVKYEGEVKKPYATITHIESGELAERSSGYLADFDEESIQLNDDNETTKTILGLARYLINSPNDTLTIYSSASYAGDRIGGRGEIFKNRFLTVLKNRTFAQSHAIREKLIGIQGENNFDARVFVRGLGEEGAYDKEGKGLGIRTRVVVNNENESYGEEYEEEVEFILPEGKKEILKSLESDESPYPIISTSVKEQKLAMEKLMGEHVGLIKFLTKVQELDGVITGKELSEIRTFIDRFVRICVSQIRNCDEEQILKDIESDARAEHLIEKFKNPKDRIAVYIVMIFFQKHVKYNKEDEFGTTFKGFIGFGPDKTNEKGDPIFMDCDIMTIVAHEILTQVGVNHVFEVQYDKDTHIANHANGNIDGEFIERTNFDHYGFEEEKWVFENKNTPSEIAACFMNTYELGEGSTLLDKIHRERMRYSMDRENIWNICIYISRYADNLRTLMDDNGDITSKHIDMLVSVVDMLYAIFQHESGEDFTLEEKDKEKYIATVGKIKKIVEKVDIEYTITADPKRIANLLGKITSIRVDKL